MLGLLTTIAALPWLQGFSPSAVAEHGKRAVVEEMAKWQPADDECLASVYGGLAVDADVTPAPGDERVLASFTQGMVVLDRDRKLIARAPGFMCQGSADTIEAVAVGDAWIGTPVIALVATAGGHNESTTWLTLYRVGTAGELVAMFSGEVEHHEGHTTTTGVVLVYPGGLLYRTPSGETQMWRFDPDQRRYIDRGNFGPAV